MAVASKRAEQLAQWHRWFAWFPVRTDSGVCCWLEIVERKCVAWPSDYGCFWHVFVEHKNYREVSL